MKKEAIFFDLDGVISDSKEGITKSVDYAMQKFGVKASSPDEYLSFVGPPLMNQFQNVCGFDEKKAQKAVEYYREYYTKTGIFENSMYAGMDNVLKMLHQKGVKILLATSKPTEFARQIIDRYGILSYFDDVCGSSMDNSRTKKEDVISYAMEKNGLQNPDAILMVGDRKHDIIGARACKMDCVAVEYGYGSHEEFLEYHPRYMVSDMDELYRLLVSLT